MEVEVARQAEVGRRVVERWRKGQRRGQRVIEKTDWIEA